MVRCDDIWGSGRRVPAAASAAAAAAAAAAMCDLWREREREREKGEDGDRLDEKKKEFMLYFIDVFCVWLRPRV